VGHLVSINLHQKQYKHAMQNTIQENIIIPVFYPQMLWARLLVQEREKICTSHKLTCLHKPSTDYSSLNTNLNKINLKLQR
jgi:hypothetical protein